MSTYLIWAKEANRTKCCWKYQHQTICRDFCHRENCGQLVDDTQNSLSESKGKGANEPNVAAASHSSFMSRRFGVTFSSSFTAASAAPPSPRRALPPPPAAVTRRHRDRHCRHGGGDGVADDDGAVPAACCRLRTVIPTG